MTGGESPHGVQEEIDFGPAPPHAAQPPPSSTGAERWGAPPSQLCLCHECVQRTMLDYALSEVEARMGMEMGLL